MEKRPNAIGRFPPLWIWFDMVHFPDATRLRFAAKCSDRELKGCYLSRPEKYGEIGFQSQNFQ
jgi:hypothetical protein